MNTYMILIICLPVTFSASEKDLSVTEKKTSSLEREGEDNEADRRREVEIIDKYSGNFERVYGRGSDGGVAIPQGYQPRQESSDGSRNIIAPERGAGGFYGEGRRGLFDRKDILQNDNGDFRFGRGDIGNYGGFGDQDGLKGFRQLCRRGRHWKPIYDYEGDSGIGLKGGFNIGGEGKLNIRGYGGFNAGKGGGFDLAGYGGIDLG